MTRAEQNKIEFLRWWNTIPSEYTQQRAPAIIHALLAECVDAKTLANMFMNWTPEYQAEFFGCCMAKVNEYNIDNYIHGLDEAFDLNSKAKQFVRDVLSVAVSDVLKDIPQPITLKEFQNTLEDWMEHVRKIAKEHNENT